MDHDSFCDNRVCLSKVGTRIDKKMIYKIGEIVRMDTLNSSFKKLILYAPSNWNNNLQLF